MGEAAADPRAAPPARLARAARGELFDAALTHAWDADHGGLYYGFGPDFTICDHNKYFWVQAETFAAAAMLGARTGSERWDWYDEIWRYSWALRRSPLRRVVPHPHLRQPQVQRRESPAGKTDYHTMGACYDVLATLARAQRSEPTQ